MRIPPCNGSVARAKQVLQESRAYSKQCVLQVPGETWQALHKCYGPLPISAILSPPRICKPTHKMGLCAIFTMPNDLLDSKNLLLVQVWLDLQLQPAM